MATKITVYSENPVRVSYRSLCRQHIVTFRELFTVLLIMRISISDAQNWGFLLLKSPNGQQDPPKALSCTGTRVLDHYASCVEKKVQEAVRSKPLRWMTGMTGRKVDRHSLDQVADRGKPVRDFQVLMCIFRTSSGTRHHCLDGSSPNHMTCQYKLQAQKNGATHKLSKVAMCTTLSGGN